MVVFHRFREIGGRRLFYREAGHSSDPAIVLLHGFPTSSRMFRDLIPLLADRYHVIAPDHLGFGLSDAPPVKEFDYTFDALADLTRDLLDQLGRGPLRDLRPGLRRAHRLAARAARTRDAITAIVTQNGNGYSDGFVAAFWTGLGLRREPGPETEPGRLRRRSAWRRSAGSTRTACPTRDAGQPRRLASTTSAGRRARQRRGAAGVVPRLPDQHRALPGAARTSCGPAEVPLLAVWGRNDEIFGPAGATAFARDLPDAEIHLLDGGHFLLESQLDTVAGYLRGFLGRVLQPA